MTRGAEFSEIQPRTPEGLLRNAFAFGFPGDGSIDYDPITQVTPNNSFRLGQQIMFWIGLENPQVFLQDSNFQPIPGTENWVTRIRLKPWWARPNFEKRQAYGGSGRPGSDTVFPIDRQNFAGATLTNNRYVWIPSPKRFDITQFDPGPTPPPSPVRNSDSLMLDECWTWDLDSPTSAGYQGAFLPPFVPSRWSVLFQPAMGYALGFTAEAVYNRIPGPTVARPFVRVSITWASGTLGGSNYQESVG